MNKHRLRNGLAALLLAGMFVFTPGMTCKNGASSGQAIVFQTLKGVQVSVDSAMKVYATAVVTGNVTLEKQQEIDRAHLSYRMAFAQAVALARNDYNQIAPEDVVRLANQLQVLISRL